MESQLVDCCSPATESINQSTLVQRRSLHVSHFDALHNALSDLARIDDFDLEELGVGFFSDVFKATHKQTGQVVVLKRNKPTNTKLNILREIQLMNRLSHPNVLKFIGVCVHEGQLHGLTEFVNGGDLNQLLTNKSIVLSWKQRISLALDIARAMSYLHSVGIFHRDLSSNNCLVRVQCDNRKNKKYTGVLADLGLAEKIPTCQEDEERLGVVGTPYIIAPEVLHGKRYNEKADVFSYGLILCQFIARVSFDPEELPRSKDFGLARDLFVTLITPPQLDNYQSHPPPPPPPPDCFLQLAFDCCELDATSRPSFNEVVLKLEKMLDAEMKSHFPKTFYSQDEVRRTSPRRSTQQRPRITSPKLSRTNSDISRELLQHARAVACSTSYNIAEERDAFDNPFDAFEWFNYGPIKLVDEPSLALFELTFDLATSESLITSWTRQDMSKKKRPKSQFIAERHHHIEKNEKSDLSSMSGHTAVDGLSETRSSRASCSEEILSQCDDCNFQRAMHRAMILSPLGTHMASWWCNHCRESRDDLPSQRQAMAAVMSVLSRGQIGIRRSISVPDLSKSAALFHHVDEEAENRILHSLDLPHGSIGSCTAISKEESSSAIQNQTDSSSNKHLTPENLSLKPVEDCNDSNVILPPPLSPGYCASIEMTVKTGEVSRQHRRNRLSPPKNSIMVNANASKMHNRDSGYDDAIVDSLPVYRERHVSWEIPEEAPPSFAFPHCDIQLTN